MQLLLSLTSLIGTAIQLFFSRGYLDDRVNRLIGYAIVRQVREEIGTCRTAKIIRDTISDCTGDGGMDREDDRDWCLGWMPKTYDNCTQASEFE